jgi:hypothetical protein
MHLEFSPSAPLKRLGKADPRTGHEGLEEEWRYSSNLSLTSAQDTGGYLCHTPASLLAGLTQYSLCGRLGGIRRPVWKGGENVSPWAFDPRTVHPVASRTVPPIIRHVAPIPVLQM